MCSLMCSPRTDHLKASSTRSGRHRLARASLILFALVCVLVTTGAVYQAVMTEVDRRALPAPGQLVDVGGYRLHLRCLGSGSPTVILESALGAGSSVWA